MSARSQFRMIGAGLGLGLLLLSACGGGGGGEEAAPPLGRATLGPIAGATVEIYEIPGDGTFPLLHTQTTSTGDTCEACGWFDAVPIALDPSKLYLFKAFGGTDVDPDDDGVMDDPGQPMNGPISALVPGSQAGSGELRLSALTSIMGHRLAYMLISRYTPEEMLVAMDECAVFFLRSDLDGDGKVTAADVLRWDPATDKTALRKSWDHFENLLDALHDGDQGWVAWESEVLADSAIAFVQFDDDVQDVHVVGDKAYVAIEDTGFAIVDVSDPRAPEILSVVDTLGNGEDLGVQGDFVYFARRADGPMQIYDVSDPTNPTPRGSVPLSEPDCMYPDGSLLFAADRDDHRIHIIDVTDPDAPFEVSSVQTVDDPNQVVRVGKYLYVADTDGLTVIDIQNLLMPFVRADIETPRGDVDGLVVQNGYAYCADGEDGLVVIDVSDLDDLQIVAEVSSRCECDRIWIDGTTLYMSANEAGVQIMDISTADDPVHLGYCAVANRARVTCTAGGYAYVACDGAGLRIFDLAEVGDAMLTDLHDDLILATLDPGRRCEDIVASGDLAYIAIEKGLSIVDISAPTTPSLVSKDDTWDGENRALAKQGNFVYLANGDYGLRIVDVTDPENPGVKPAFSLSDEANDVAVQGDYAYVADRYNAEFIVVNVSNPDAPVWVGDDHTAVGDSCRSVAAEGSWAFGAWGQTGLASVDVSDPALPNIIDTLEMHDVGSTDPDFAHKVEVQGDYAYVMAEELHVVDISDPTDLTFVSTIEIESDENFTLTDDFALVLQDTDGIRIVNIEDPTNPWRFVTIPSFGQVRAACVHNGLLLVVLRNKGLIIMRAPFTTDLPY